MSTRKAAPKWMFTDAQVKAMAAAFGYEPGSSNPERMMEAAITRYFQEPEEAKK